MRRLIPFALGVLVGIVLKWQYDEQQTAPAGEQSVILDPATTVQEIPIAVASTTAAADRSTATAPAEAVGSI